MKGAWPILSWCYFCLGNTGLFNMGYGQWTSEAVSELSIIHQNLHWTWSSSNKKRAGHSCLTSVTCPGLGHSWRWSANSLTKRRDYSNFVISMSASDRMMAFFLNSPQLSGHQSILLSRLFFLLADRLNSACLSLKDCWTPAKTTHQGLHGDVASPPQANPTD